MSESHGLLGMLSVAWAMTAIAVALAVVGAVFVVRRKHLDRWMSAWLFGNGRRLRSAGPSRMSRSIDADGTRTHVDGDSPWRRFRRSEPVTVFIAVCDHFEPDNGNCARTVADARMKEWAARYPKLAADIEDSRGRGPQHTFFYPADEYFVPGYLDQLRDIREAGWGDVEIHLHHDGDTADQLREKLVTFRDALVDCHGLLRSDPRTGETVWGFIHGNWALCNSRVDGRWCGVNDELTVLRECGCYADFTMPSAPERTQTRIINSIYYAQSSAERPSAHNRGIAAQLGMLAPKDHLLMIQGPLTFNFQQRRRGVIPRIENGDLIGSNPPTVQRFQYWLRCGVHVAGRPDWCFVKLHTHGCKDGNLEMLLGEPYRSFHRDLAEFRAANENLRIYYVTAYEMARLVHQAEAGLREPDWSFASGANAAVSSVSERVVPESRDGVGAGSSPRQVVM